MLDSGLVAGGVACALLLGFCASVLAAGLVLLCGSAAGGVDSAGAVVVVVLVVVVVEGAVALCVAGVVSVGFGFCSAGVRLDGCAASVEAGLFGF